MRRIMCAVWCIFGVLVFPDILPVTSSNGIPRLSADVGEMTDQEYATLMSFYLAPPNEPEVAEYFNMLLVPPDSDFDYEEFIFFYIEFMDTTCVPPGSFGNGTNAQ